MRQDKKNGSSLERDTTFGGPSLYLVATPIGNLEDITLRALRVLKEVDLIACEDTRQTLKLLSHYGIQTRLVSYHEHNEMTKASELVVDLEGGAKIALVTDAGMPGGAGGQRPGHRFLPLQRLPSRQVRTAPQAAGEHKGLSAHPGVLRSSASAIGNAGRRGRRVGKRPPRSSRARSNENSRRIPAWSRQRRSGSTRSARRSQRRNHAADSET